MHIDREDMLELTRRMTIARNCFNRVAGAYMDEEGFIDGSFNTHFLKLSPADKEKKPLKLTKATYIAAGAGVVVLLIAAAVIWFMIQRKQEEERMRVLREKRRKRLADMGCSEEEFERLVNERKNALRERTMPEPDDDDGSGDEVSDHSEDLPEEYPDDEYDSWEDEHEDDLDDPDEKEDVPGEDR